MNASANMLIVASFFCCSLLKSHTTNFTPNLDRAKSSIPFFLIPDFNQLAIFFSEALEVWIPYTPPRYPFNFFYGDNFLPIYTCICVFPNSTHRDLIDVFILQVHNLISDPQALDPPSFIEKRNNVFYMHNS